jgi:light-regulated signal transduction histidine kinase (bacteriophytochrome)
MANRAAGGDLEAKAPETSAGEIGQVAREVNHLVAATQAERVDLEARLRVLDDEARSLRAAARQREAELEAQLRLASRYLREPVLSVHACANLLARDCAGRMDAQGRERLDQLRTSAEALDMRLGELLEGCRSKRTQNDSTTCRGVVASGDQGDAVRGK